MIHISDIAAPLSTADSERKAAFDEMAVRAQRPPADHVFVRRNGWERDRVTVFFDH